jgi:hypothetical protein
VMVEEGGNSVSEVSVSFVRAFVHNDNNVGIVTVKAMSYPHVSLDQRHPPLTLRS